MYRIALGAIILTLAVGVSLALSPSLLVVPVAAAILIVAVLVRRRFVLPPTLFVALAALAIAAEPARADTGLLDAVRPVLIDIATIVIAAAVALAAQRFQAWTGIQIEARHREALQSALANAARVAIEGGGAADVARAIGYVQKSVPDALRHFDVGDADRIAELLKPHLVAARTALPA